MKRQKTGQEILQSSIPAANLDTQKPIAATESTNLEENTSSASLDERAEGHKLTGAAGLGIILGQLVAYFSDHADADDLDVLSFSLHHLFCHTDRLFQVAFPTLAGEAVGTTTEPDMVDILLHQYQVWTDLQAIKRILHRLGPLGHLLGDAAECVLQTLDQLDDPALHTEDDTQALPVHAEEEHWLHALKQERWEHALTALTGNLTWWHLYYSRIPSLAAQFPHLAETVPALPQLDKAFSLILDSTGAIFGDILPAFQAISAGEDEAVATLLFDLMQQADQLLLQLQVVQEPLDQLIEQFTADATMNCS